MGLSQLVGLLSLLATCLAPVAAIADPNPAPPAAGAFIAQNTARRAEIALSWLGRLRAARTSGIVRVDASCATSCGPGADGSCSRSCPDGQSCLAHCESGHATCDCR